MEEPNNNSMDEQTIRKAYAEHPIFEEMKYYVDFYESLSDHALEPTVKASVFNPNFHAFEDMKSTLSSIAYLLKKGSLLDAYALLMKFYNASTLHIYTVLYAKELERSGRSPERQLRALMESAEPLPDIDVVDAYIAQYEEAFEITGLFRSKLDPAKFRADTTRLYHDNYLFHSALNHEMVRSEQHLVHLSMYDDILCFLIIQHMGYLFFMDDDFMRSSRFEQYLAYGVVPSEESTFEVAAYIQRFCNRIVKPRFPEVYDEIKRKTKMRLK